MILDIINLNRNQPFIFIEQLLSKYLVRLGWVEKYLKMNQQ